MNTENYAVDWSSLSPKNILDCSGYFMYIKWKMPSWPRDMFSGEVKQKRKEGKLKYEQNK